MKLYFENSKGKRKIISRPKTEEDAFKAIRDFCEERKFKIHYIRTWENEEGLKVYDVGSWTEFFLLSSK